MAGLSLGGSWAKQFPPIWGWQAGLPDPAKVVLRLNNLYLQFTVVKKLVQKTFPTCVILQLFFLDLHWVPWTIVQSIGQCCHTNAFYAGTGNIWAVVNFSLVIMINRPWHVKNNCKFFSTTYFKIWVYTYIWATYTFDPWKSQIKSN